jgi:hypothetical protein
MNTEQEKAHGSTCGQQPSVGVNETDRATFFPIESAECLSCNSQIPQQNISINVLTDYSGPGVKQRLRAWCDHCQVLYQRDRVNRGMFWEWAGPMLIVTDERQRQSFQRRLDHLRGNIRVSRTSGAGTGKTGSHAAGVGEKS